MDAANAGILNGPVSRSVGVREAGRRLSLGGLGSSNGANDEAEHCNREKITTSKLSHKTISREAVWAILEAKEQLRIKNSADIQGRAAQHLEATTHQLVNLSGLSRGEEWKQAIINLVNEVVSSVDPDVRCGDNMDIRSYVNVKIIPGGHT